MDRLIKSDILKCDFNPRCFIEVFVLSVDTRKARTSCNSEADSCFLAFNYSKQFNLLYTVGRTPRRSVYTKPFIYFNIHTCHKPYKEGALGFSVLRIWPMFGSVFALENCGFQFCILPRFAGFLEFSLWFMLFVSNDGGFSVIFVPPRILRFFWFCQGSYISQWR